MVASHLLCAHKSLEWCSLTLVCLHSLFWLQSSRPTSCQMWSRFVDSSSLFFGFNWWGLRNTGFITKKNFEACLLYPFFTAVLGVHCWGNIQQFVYMISYKGSSLIGLPFHLTDSKALLLSGKNEPLHADGAVHVSELSLEAFGCLAFKDGG